MKNDTTMSRAGVLTYLLACGELWVACMGGVRQRDRITKSHNLPVVGWTWRLGCQRLPCEHSRQDLFTHVKSVTKNACVWKHVFLKQSLLNRDYFEDNHFNFCLLRQSVWVVLPQNRGDHSTLSSFLYIYDFMSLSHSLSNAANLIFGDIL